MRLTEAELRRLIQEMCGSVHAPEEASRDMGDGGPAGMARGQLFTVAQKAQSLHDRLRDDDELPEWVQSKVAVVHDYMSTIDDFLGYKMFRADAGDPIPEARHRELMRIVAEASGEDVSNADLTRGLKTGAADMAAAIPAKLNDEFVNMIKSIVAMAQHDRSKFEKIVSIVDKYDDSAMKKVDSVEGSEDDK